MIRKVIWLFFAIIAVLALVIKAVVGVMGLILILAAWLI